jgi:hypothetical protein
MKNILLGSICLAIFALAISVVQSCQKTDAQINNRPASPSAAGLVLYENAAISQVIPFTHVDSLGNRITD